MLDVHTNAFEVYLFFFYEVHLTAQKIKERRQWHDKENNGEWENIRKTGPTTVVYGAG